MVSNYRHPEKLHRTFDSPEKLALLPSMKKVKPPPDRKMTKLQDLITCFRNYDILAKTCSRMTTAITFSRQMKLVHARAFLGIEKFRNRIRSRLRIMRSPMSLICPFEWRIYPVICNPLVTLQNIASAM